MAKTIRNKGTHLLEFQDEYIVFDLETTGLSPEYDEIIEFSGFKIKNNEIVDHFSTLIKPVYPVDAFITSLTGISNAMLENELELPEVIDRIDQFIGSHVLLGHNVHFDLNFLYDAMLFHKQKELRNDFVDLLRISRKVHPEWKSHTLSNVSENLQTAIKPSHRASNDALATYQAYEIYKNQIRKNGIVLDTKSYQDKYKIASIVPSVEISDSCLLHGEEFVFTGRLDKMERKVAWQLVVDNGGFISDAVTRRTNFLILGNVDYSSQVKNGKSSKLKKAEELILDGQDLKIISENVFYDMLDR